MNTRVVITGLGVVAPTGGTPAEHWDSLHHRRSGVRRITHFDPSNYPVQVAGEVDGDLRSRIASKIAVQTDRWTWMGLDATAQALADAQLDLSTLDPYDVSVVLASSSGGNAFGQGELQRLWRDPARTVGAYQSIAWFYAATVGQISIAHGAKGPSTVVVSEAAGGLDSLAQAARAVRRGTPVVIAGGVEAPLSPYALTCQLAQGRMTATRDDTGAYRPFDRDARGWVPGEGGAVFVVESLEHARDRGARVYAEIAGHAATHDARHTGQARAPRSGYYEAALRGAVDRAGIDAREVDLFVPDASGVRADDAAEAAAVGEVFGGRAVPVSTHKALTGRLHQGGSALDAATAALALARSALPAGVAPETPAAGCEHWHFVDRTTPAELTTALVGARGFDGFNSGLVLRRTDDLLEAAA